MANKFYFTPNGIAKQTIQLADGTDTNLFVLAGTEHGVSGPPAKVRIDKTPDRVSDQYRGTTYDKLDYGFTVLIKDSTAGALETRITNWYTNHNPSLGMGVFERVTIGGNTRQLDCVPTKTELERMGPCAAEIKQTYEAPLPFWRSATATNVADDLDGTTPVNISCANGGIIASYPVITVTGVWATSLKFTNSDGDYIEVEGAGANADDEVIINCLPWGTYRRTVRYLEHGAGAGVYWPIVPGSRYVTIPTGTNNLAGVLGGAGTPTVSIDYYLYYGSLY